jgi:hypothetical protein
MRWWKEREEVEEEEEEEEEEEQEKEEKEEEEEEEEEKKQKYHQPEVDIKDLLNELSWLHNESRNRNELRHKGFICQLEVEYK